ncbi:MAG: ATP-binding protein [Terriglobales bacterium]
MVFGGNGEPSTSSRTFLSGGSEMGALMRTMDWSRTKLGPIERWPQSLRTSVSTCLNSRFAILVWWGPDLVMLYNDAYREIIASKHPAALGNPGRECWPEIWETIGPMLEGVMQRGEATWSDDLLLLLARHGYPEECYFTFSYSPISDESGGIGGVFTPVMETTDRVIGERRSNTLRELAGCSVKAKSEEMMWDLAAEILGANPYDVSFSVLYGLAADRKTIEPKRWTGILPDDVLCRGPKELGRADSPLLRAIDEAVSTGKMVLIGDLQEHCPELSPGVWGIAPVEAMAMPFASSGPGSPVGCMLLGLNARKRFDRDYGLFLETLGRQLGSNLAAARAHEEETRRAEMLAELDRAKTVFFSNVSHEFRTPLTLIVGPVENMLAGARPSAFVSREELQLVHRNSMRLLKLVNTLLDFSRIEAGRVEAIYEPTDLSTFTAETASAFRSAMEQAGLEFVIDCEPLAEPAYVDRDMWEKIVLNLISNAFKFTLTGGVRVRLRSAGDRIELKVEDTGLGIPQEEQSKVFERFHRIEGVRGRTHEGTGIGLALVQELVRLHGGSIRVESVVGRGSTFVVSIPMGRAHLPENCGGAQQRMLKSTGVSAAAYVDEALRWLPEGAQTAEPGEVFAADTVQAPHIQTTGGRILLVDDNADMRGYVRRLLGSNYDVHAVSTGTEALAAIRSHAPDLVLTDVMMPGLDGFGLLREIRASDATKTIPVILLSARAGEDARIEGMEAGADDYMVKPFTARELLARVGAHLAMGRLRREAEEHERALRAEAEAAHRRTSTILESISDSFFALDREWRFTYVNAEAEQTLRMSRDYLIGKTFWEAMPPAKGTALETQYRRAMSERVSIQFENYYLSWGRWYDVRAYPADDGGISVFYQDITERKRIEEAVRESEDRFRTLADNIPALSWMADREGNRFWFNRRWFEYTGTTLEEMREKGWRAVHHPEHIERLSESFSTSIATGRGWEETVPLRGRDGSYRWFLSRAVPIKNEAGEIIRWFGSNTDITEQKLTERALEEARLELESRVEKRTSELQRANEELRQLSSRLQQMQDEERRRLARGLHDSAGQLLAALSMNIAEVSSEAHKLSPETAARVAENAGLVEQLTNEVRTISHLLHPPLLDEVGLSSALRWFVEGFAQRSKIAATLEMPETLERFSADVEIAVFRAVQECLTNVHRHSGSRSCVVSVFKERDNLRVEVRDEGRGIPNEKRLALTSSGGGVGLRGMQERIRQLGGTVVVRSSQNGTSVVVTLPIRAEGVSRNEGVA